MAESKVEKVLAPVAIGLGVIGVWLALRKPAAAMPVSPVVQASGPGLAIPALPPLQTTEYGPLTGPTAATGSGTSPGTGVVTGAAPITVETATAYPLAPVLSDPFAALPTADYLSYNLPPWLSTGKLLASMDNRKALNTLLGVQSGSTFITCGCGNPNCDGSSCDQTVVPRQPDGHGSCLAAGPTIPQAQADQQIGAMRYFSTDPWNLVRGGPSPSAEQAAPALMAG